MLFHTTVNRRCTPRRRGPAKILNMYETGTTAKNQSPTFKVARDYIRKHSGGKSGGAMWNPALGAVDPRKGFPLENLEGAQKFTKMPFEADGGRHAPRTDLRQDNSGPHARRYSSVFPRSILLPECPHLSGRLPSSPAFSAQIPPPDPSFQKQRPSPQAPVMTGYANSASSAGIAGRDRGRSRIRVCP